MGRQSGAFGGVEAASELGCSDNAGRRYGFGSSFQGKRGTALGFKEGGQEPPTLRADQNLAGLRTERQGGGCLQNTSRDLIGLIRPFRCTCNDEARIDPRVQLDIRAGHAGVEFAQPGMQLE